MSITENKCKFCEKTFTMKSNLYRHIAMKHGDLEKFTCTECFQEFSVESSLIRHIKSHLTLTGLSSCYDCHKNFVSVFSLKRHFERVHGSNRSGSYECVLCSHRFFQKYNLMKHMKSHVNYFATHKKKCPICGFSGNKTEIFEHFQIEHDIVLSRVVLNFKTIEEFNSWKNKEEKNEQCYFSTRNLTRYKEPGTFRKIYECHRNGEFSSKGKQKRSLKIIGTNKIDGFCPAQLDVKNLQSGVTVQYTKTHVGHSAEINRLRLTTDEKDSIAQKIASKVEFDSILADIKCSTDEDGSSRIHLLNKKDLYNIQKKYNLNQETKTSKKDSSSVDSQLPVSSYCEDLHSETVIEVEEVHDYLECEVPEEIVIDERYGSTQTYCVLAETVDNSQPSIEDMKLKLLEDFTGILNMAETTEDFTLIVTCMDSLKTALIDSKNN